MNFFDFLFENSKELDKDLLLGKEPVSYRTMYNQAIALSKVIVRKCGTQKNIVLLAPNSFFFVVSYLAIIKSGNVCVPLNPGIEQTNLQYILKECESKFIFIAENVLKRLVIADLEIITENILNSEADRDDTVYSIVTNKAEINALAEIIFTSGSTGLPKGAMISHKNLIANTQSIIAYLGLTNHDIMEVVLPFYYCYGLSLLHTHIRAGGSLIFNNNFMFIGQVINDIKEYKCTGFAGVPSHYQFLLRKTKNFKTTEFPYLRYVTQAGGKLSPVFIEEFRTAFPSVQFYVMYGQTEATARLSYLSPERLKDKLGSIGKAIPGVELEIWDDSGKHLPPNQTGELVAKGDNVMSGYYKDENLTRLTLSDGCLKTGDLAYKDEDGFIFISGRKKEMMKIRGRRVNPKEIEDVILKIPQIVDCIIEAYDDEALGESLMATVAINEADSNLITDEFIRDFCSKELMQFKVPTKILFNKSLKISPTGKRIVEIKQPSIDLK